MELQTCTCMSFDSCGNKIQLSFVASLPLERSLINTLNAVDVLVDTVPLHNSSKLEYFTHTKYLLFVHSLAHFFW